jgi:hypothetical protein
MPFHDETYLDNPEKIMENFPYGEKSMNVDVYSHQKGFLCQKIIKMLIYLA